MLAICSEEEDLLDVSSTNRVVTLMENVEKSSLVLSNEGPAQAGEVLQQGSKVEGQAVVCRMQHQEWGRGGESRWRLPSYAIAVDTTRAVETGASHRITAGAGKNDE
jgi:hypothetical protein